jgi:hypothetical protein
MPRRRTQQQQQQHPRHSRRTQRINRPRYQQRLVAHLREIEEARLRAGEPRRSLSLRAAPPGTRYVLFGEAGCWDPTDFLGEELPPRGFRRAWVDKDREDSTEAASTTMSITSTTETASTNSSLNYSHTPEGVRKTTPDKGLQSVAGRGQLQAACDNEDTEGPKHAGREQHNQVRPGTQTAERETDNVTSNVTIG